LWDTVGTWMRIKTTGGIVKRKPNVEE